MSLRDNYFNGASGIQQQMDAAFAEGVAYVGSGAVDISTINLNDRNGSNLGAGASTPGLYFLCSSPTTAYAVWYQVTSEVAPTVGGAVTVQVNISSGDTATQVATKTATALNAILTEPFEASSLSSVIEIENNVAGTVFMAISAGTLGGTAAAAQVQAGSFPTGNFAILQSGLVTAAAKGHLNFMIKIQGTGTANASYLRSRNGDNLVLKSFFAGIMQAMATENIYNYQLYLQLDVSDQVSTNVNFNFNFGDKHRYDTDSCSSCGCECHPLTVTQIKMKACNPNMPYYYEQIFY